MQIFISMFDTATMAKLNWFVSCDPFSRFLQHFEIAIVYQSHFDE